MNKLHEEWLRLVYGPKTPRKRRRRETIPPMLTHSVDRVNKPFPHKMMKGYHLVNPDVTIYLRAQRHDDEAVFEMARAQGVPIRRQQPKPKKLELRVSKITLCEVQGKRTW